MKKLLLFSLAFVLIFANLALAEPFSARLVSYESLIMQGEEAKFNFLITNELDVNQRINVRFPPNSGWSTFTDPLSDYTFTLSPKGTKSLTILVSPRVTFATGPYAVPVVLNSVDFDFRKQFNLPVQLYRSEQREFVPIVNHEINIPFENDPRNPLSLQVNLNNLNFRNISALNIEVSSELFYEDRVINLGPMDKKSEEFIFDIDDLLVPTEDRVNVRIWAEHDGRIYEWTRSSVYRIISYSELLKEESEFKSFLKTEVFLSLKNDANVEKYYEIPLQISFFRGLFSSFEPRYSYVLSSNEGRFLVWNFNLEAQEEFSIYIKTNYRPIAIFFILIILLVVMYFVLRPPILVKKEVSHVGTSEGGISDIKVMLFVKNRTGNVIEDISIIEKIPHLASIGKEFQVGTLMPSKVMQNPKKGTLVRWDLQTLESHEERIITYKIKSKLSILGGLTLPATIVKYSVRGRESKTKSNKLILDI